jgi:hypothetical protein
VGQPYYERIGSSSASEGGVPKIFLECLNSDQFDFVVGFESLW